MMALIHVLAIGRKDCTAAVKSNEGCNLNPNRGSSSDPVANHKTWARVTLFLLPPVKASKMKRTNSLLITKFVAEKIN